MLYAIALFFPGLSMILAGRALPGLACVVLQCTLIGWIPATLWAFFVIQERNTGRQFERLHRGRGVR